MTDRRDRNGTSGQFDELFGADAFLDDLSRGVDPTGGKDPLAQLMLELHQQVNAPMPPAPSLDDLLPAEATAPTTAPADDLAARRAKKRRLVNPWVSGLVGAAAATLVIAGGGGAIYNANPSSPLWGAKIAMFGEHAAVVDLASALQEVDQRHADGDIEGAMQLLDRARALADAVNARDRASTQRAIAELEARTVQVPTTITETAAPSTTTSIVTSEPNRAPQQNPEPTAVTVVQTKVTTETVTVTVEKQPVATQTPTATPEPTTMVTIAPSPSPVAQTQETSN
ncbi:hypothetical protein [Corynebacterium epidermidicanis]|uniref:Anti-sigma-D factor RsdA sigma factor binding region domain-containing protein n=1 Tax=Corynebacterium epidermidicanis TaxID=1050174 RepID=A0A0G3GMB1_9CORY|nr:hypothetical protein [Corynebacterium epidermidicanis]AKK02371.1 hypothetical protein CEPID_02450 [Corynebacterium epidermidicanis]